jgi:GT2 family glycosyltransferase
MVFSDEDQFEGARRCRPYFKPGWNPDLMLAQNLTCHLAVYRRSLVQQAGGLRASFDGSQDYDLALRATRAARRVRHVPDVLYHWRQSETSFSARHAQHCVQAARRALAEDLGEAARVEPAPGLPQWNQIVYALPAPPPKVCMILPPGGQPPADAAYPAIEVLHGDEDGAARLMASDVLLFLAAGLTPTAPGWVAELAGHALRPEIGCAGARIDGPDGRIRHAGFMLDPRRVAVTLQPRSDVDDPGYRGQFMLARSVSAISRACLAVRRDVFLRAGGFDAACGALADVDLCLRLSASGLRCVWTPHARLLLSALPMPAPDAACIALMRARWGAVLANDPYVNPNLVVRAGNLALADAAAAPRKRLP